MLQNVLFSKAGSRPKPLAFLVKAFSYQQRQDPLPDGQFLQSIGSPARLHSVCVEG